MNVTPPDGSTAPIMSTVVCTHNRPDDVEACLGALVQQRRPETEIIVVDSACNPDARGRLMAFAAAHPEIVVERLDAPGLCAARNAGLARARGEWVAMLDDDALPDADWAAEALALLARIPSDVGVIGAYTSPIWPTDTAPPLPPLWKKYLSLIEEEWEGDATDNPQFVGANMFFRRSPLVEIGGFSPAFGRVGALLLSGDEVYAAELLKKQGWRIWYSNKPRAGHRVPRGRTDPSWFRKRMFWEGATVYKLEQALNKAPSLFPAARAVAFAPALALLSIGEGPYGTKLSRALWHLGVLRGMWGR